MSENLVLVAFGFIWGGRMVVGLLGVQQTWHWVLDSNLTQWLCGLLIALKDAHLVVEGYV